MSTTTESGWFSWLNFWGWGGSEAAAGRNVPEKHSKNFVKMVQTPQGHELFVKVSPELLEELRRNLRKIEPIPRNPPPPPVNPFAKCTSDGIPGIMEQIRERRILYSND